MRHFKKQSILLPSTLILLAIFFVYVYKSAISSEEKIFQKIQESKIEEYSQIFHNFNEYLIHVHNVTNKQEFFTLLSNPKKRDLLVNFLSIINTANVKYLYVLQKDKQNRFRFLLDASKEDKANFYQKFDVSADEYSQIYTTKKPQIIKQKNIDTLYLTYLYPIIANNEIIGVASVDMDIKIHNDISTILTPFKTLFKILIALIFLVATITIIQIIYYYKSKKKLFTDPLTKLFNRNYLNEIHSTLNMNNYAIAMLDLDRFKVVNDTYGHEAGDFVLTTSARIFKESIRDDDILIRYGGEEFLLLVHTRGKNKSALEICERVRSNIGQHSFIYENQEILVTLSIGLNLKPSEEKSLNDSIKVADTQLYIAKKNGRNTVVANSKKPDQKPVQNAKDINFVKRALEESRVVCYFQPIYDYKKREIFKYEALVRIIDTNEDIVQPMQFLPHISHTNIHFKLTKHILKQCFAMSQQYDKSISINMNYSDLINDEILDIIKISFSENTNLASHITFEVLESDEIDNIELFKEKIKLLHSLGATVSIDDFGSGYSNYKTLLDIEANFLKIDGSLIKNIDSNDKDYKVVKNIIQFAREAGMRTIAEFVHSKAVYDKLIELNVDYMQGYHIAQPNSKFIEKEELF